MCESFICEFIIVSTCNCIFIRQPPFYAKISFTILLIEKFLSVFPLNFVAIYLNLLLGSLNKSNQSFFYILFVIFLFNFFYIIYNTALSFIFCFICHPFFGVFWPNSLQAKRNFSAKYFMSNFLELRPKLWCRFLLLLEFVNIATIINIIIIIIPLPRILCPFF